MMKNMKHIGFLVVRSLALISLLVWVLSSLVNSSRVNLLFLFAGLIVFWFCFSILIDFIWPAGEGSGTLRSSVFGMIDVYIAVSYLIILHDKVMIAGVVLAGYCLVATLFNGVAVGTVAAITGVLGAFNSRGLDTAAGFLPLISIFAGGMGGAGLGFAVQFARKKLVERGRRKSGEVEDAKKAAEAEAVPASTREELVEKLRLLQENFDKVCKERDQLQEQVAELEDKMQAGKGS